jgi:hypothetical protein
VLVILDKGTIFQSVKWSDQHVCNTTLSLSASVRLLSLAFLIEAIR